MVVGGGSDGDGGSVVVIIILASPVRRVYFLSGEGYGVYRCSKIKDKINSKS